MKNLSDIMQTLLPGTCKRLGDPSIEQNTLWLKRYLLRPISTPELTDEVRKLLEDFLVEMAKQGVRGLPRNDALERTVIGFAKLKLKNVVDEEMFTIL